MIKLYKFGWMGDVCDASPFCVKVEAYLRVAGLPYETLCGIKYLRKSPKGKLPNIEDEGRVVSDSSFILAYLKQRYGDTVDGGLSAADKAAAHAFTKMMDENLYWVIVHARWKLAHNWTALREAFFADISFPLNRVIPDIARIGVLRALHQHGMGRHTDEEIAEIGRRDLQALSDFLGSKPYFFGDAPTSMDATAYGFLSQMIRTPIFTAPAFDCAKSFANLAAFVDRFHTRYFSA